MQVEFWLDKLGADESKHLLVPLKTTETIERVLEVDILGIDAVCLVNWKSLVVLFEDLNYIHGAFNQLVF